MESIGELRQCELVVNEAQHALLSRAATAHGFGSIMAFLEDQARDAVVDGICTADGCTGGASVEPDQRRGRCENCGMPTVQSPLIIAGII